MEVRLTTTLDELRFKTPLYTMPEAARYLGVSPSLLRKMRSRGPADPLGAGPAYIRLSPSLIVYEISVLDAWLDAHSLNAGRAA